MVEHFPSMCGVLGSVPSTNKSQGGRERKERRQTGRQAGRQASPTKAFSRWESQPRGRGRDKLPLLLRNPRLRGGSSSVLWNDDCLDIQKLKYSILSRREPIYGVPNRTPAGRTGYKLYTEQARLLVRTSGSKGYHKENERGSVWATRDTDGSCQEINHGEDAFIKTMDGSSQPESRASAGPCSNEPALSHEGPLYL